jgi:DNA-binding NarL/FixJ family response regulator
VTNSLIKVLCVDDHPLVRKGIVAILANEPDITLAGEASSGAEALKKFREHRPDITLMDLELPDMDGVETTLAIRQECPDARIIVLTSYGRDQDISRALKAGVRGYLLKEMVPTEVIRTIRTVYDGKRVIPSEVSERLGEHFLDNALTAREVEVLTYTAQGFANKEIAYRLGTAEGTVKAHVRNILSKLGASDRTHAVTIAIQRGILHV